MRKYLKIGICVGSILLLCTGCKANLKSKSEQDTNVNSSELGTGDVISKVTTRFPQTFQYSSENFTANIDVFAPEEGYFQKGTAQKIIPDIEAIQDFFMSPEETYTKQYNYIQGNGKSFSWNDSIGRFTYQVDDSNCICPCVYSEIGNPDYNLDAYEEYKEFSFGTAEEACSDIIQTLNQIGIQVDDTWEIDTYYLDYETMSQEEIHRNIDWELVQEDYKTDWSEADNTYLFYFHPTYCGLRDYHQTMFNCGPACNSAAQITAMYNKNGIIELSVEELYDYEAEKTEVKLMEFEDVVEPVIHRYENIISENTYELESAMLVTTFTTADDDITTTRDLIPAWCFLIRETRGDGSSELIEIRIDASNGRILE